jgi:hypothetical protein
MGVAPAHESIVVVKLVTHDGKVATTGAGIVTAFYGGAMLRAAGFVMFALAACSSAKSKEAPAGQFPRAAAEACGAAMEAFGNGGVYSAFAGCADLFPSCAAAWRSLAGGDVEVMAPFRACRDAYCPTLGAPKPVVCDGRAIDDAGDGADLTALLAATLQHDHHVDAPTAQGVARVFVVPLTSAGPIALPPR